MRAMELLVEMDRLGIDVAAVIAQDGTRRVRIRARQGMVDDRLREEIRRLKPALLLQLQAESVAQAAWLATEQSSLAGELCDQTGGPT